MHILRNAVARGKYELIQRTITALETTEEKVPGVELGDAIDSLCGAEVY